MTQSVRGPDGRVHNFPDQARPEQIQAAMRQIYKMQAPGGSTTPQPTPPQPRPQPQPQPGQPWQMGTERTPWTAPNVTGNRDVDNALEPVTGYWDRYKAANKFGADMMMHGANAASKGAPSGLVGAVAGGAAYLSSPVAAALEPISRPINEYVSPILEKTFGTPPEISTPVLTSLIPGMGVVKVPGMGGAGGLKLGPPKVRLSETPSTNELRSQAGRAFKEAEDSGVVYSEGGVERLRQGVLSDLEELGFDQTLHPRVAAVLKRLDMAAEGNLTLKGLHIVRRIANRAAGSPDKSERMIVRHIIDQIDNFATKPEANDVLMGDAFNGGQALSNGIELWSRLSKAETLDSILDAADRQASKTGSGANIDNAIRQRVDQILGKTKRPRGFTKEEVAVMEKIVKGTPVRNALRLLGKAAPTGVVSGGFGIATTAVHPLGWAVPVLGFFSKIGADNLTRSAVKTLSENIRRGPPNQQAPIAPRPQPQGNQPPPPLALQRPTIDN